MTGRRNAAVEAALRDGAEGSWPALDYGDLLRWNARVRAGALALRVGEHEISFGELERRATAAARRIAATGLVEGDRVAVLGANSVSWIATSLGAMSIGCVVVPFNARYTEPEMDELFRMSEPRLLVAQERYGRRDLSAYIESAVSRFDLIYQPLDGMAVPRPESRSVTTSVSGAGVGRYARHPGMILYTSGSTASPKGCVLNQSGMIRNACLHTERLGITDSDTWFSPMPLFHAGGFIWGLTSMLTTGAFLVSQPAFDAGRAIHLIEETSATYHHGVDTMFIAEMGHPDFRPARARTLRIINSTGPQPVLERISQAFDVQGIVSKWGISEGYGNLTLSSPNDPYEKRVTTVGRRYPGIEYRIDGHGRNQPGEILVRGSSMDGYFRAPQATRDMIDDEGWLHTGDLGWFDGEGYLHYDGRVKQMLKVGGENVSALEIESLLLTDTAVQTACVIGVPDPTLGEVAIAVVEASERSGSEMRLTKLCRERLARFKRPTRIVVLRSGEMPLTATGKPDRNKIIAELAVDPTPTIAQPAGTGPQ